MTLTLQQVVSDIPGVTGLGIRRAILAGDRDPETLAQRRDSRCQHDAAASARAFQGNWREEPLVALAQALALYEVYPHPIHEGDTNIHAHLQTFADRSAGPPLPPAPRPQQQGRNQPAFAVRDPLHRLTGGMRPRSRGLTRRQH